MAVTWSEAPTEVLELAKRIIDRYHDHLRGARILFVMRSEAPINKGRVTLGKAKKISAEMQVYLDADFLIWLAEDEWRRLSALQKEALIDHELSHCFWDGIQASLRGHDVEEFNHIIAHYGAWWPQSDAFAVAVQHALPITNEREGSVATIDFGKIAKGVESALRAEGHDVEVTHVPASSRSQ
jgi:hypothetical protein